MPETWQPKHIGYATIGRTFYAECDLGSSNLADFMDWHFEVFFQGGDYPALDLCNQLEFSSIYMFLLIKNLT